RAAGRLTSLTTAFLFVLALFFSPVAKMVGSDAPITACDHWVLQDVVTGPGRSLPQQRRRLLAGGLPDWRQHPIRPAGSAGDQAAPLPLAREHRLAGCHARSRNCEFLGRKDQSHRVPSVTSQQPAAIVGRWKSYLGMHQLEN